MKGLSEIKTREQCNGCKLRSETYFCSLPDHEFDDLSVRKIAHAYPKGSTLFVEGQPANGVYILCFGRVKLSTYSQEGRSLIVRIAEPGEVLGLSACIAGVSFEATAKAIADCQVNFVSRKDFVELLKNDCNAALNAIRELSRLYHKAHTLICSLGLSGSAGEKLANLFLGWCGPDDQRLTDVRIPMSFTHEEIAEMIGTSRETVTRLLRSFRERDLVRVEGRDLIVPDTRRLRSATS